MRHTILVIDDQWSMQELARMILHSAGYRVLLAGDGVTGLTLARTEAPDVIVLDSRLPEMEGEDFLRELRQERRTAAIPVIFIASTPMIPPVGAGVLGCLTKPFPPPALVTLVERALNEPHIQIAV